MMMLERPFITNKIIPGIRKFENGEYRSISSGICSVAPLGSDNKHQPPARAEIPLNIRRMMAVTLYVLFIAPLRWSACTDGSPAYCIECEFLPHRRCWYLCKCIWKELVDEFYEITEWKAIREFPFRVTSSRLWGTSPIYKKSPDGFRRGFNTNRRKLWTD